MDEDRTAEVPVVGALTDLPDRPTGMTEDAVPDLGEPVEDGTGTTSAEVVDDPSDPAQSSDLPHPSDPAQSPDLVHSPDLSPSPDLAVPAEAEDRPHSGDGEDRPADEAATQQVSGASGDDLAGDQQERLQELYGMPTPEPDDR